MDYQELIKRVSDKCINSKENVLVIGPNASGKTDIIKTVIGMAKEEECCYLIDSVNKKFYLKNVLFTEGSVMPDYLKVTEARLKPDTFNIKDSFDFPIENLLSNHEIRSDFEHVLKDYLGVPVVFRQVKERDELLGVTGEFRVAVDIGVTTIFEGDTNECRLSDGQQSIFRILLELIYCNKAFLSVHDQRAQSKKIVLIDEIDTFLDKSNAYKFFDFIVAKFPKFHFIVTTHSADVLYGAKKGKIYALSRSWDLETDDQDFYVYSAEDIDSISLAESLLRRVNKNDGNNYYVIDNMEKQLSYLFNHAISGEFGAEDRRCFEEIPYQNLSNSNKLLYESIFELDKKNNGKY